MLAKRIIPCLDVKNGRVVKGINFEGLRDAGNPIELAKRYCLEAADEIVFLDISASAENRSTRKLWVRKAAKQLDVPFTVGGGISNLEDIRDILLSGADKVSINTAAVLNPKLICEASQLFGSQCIIAAIDAKLASATWKGELTDGVWRTYIYGGGVPTNKNAVEWAAECQELGAGEILLTSIDTDGTKKGFDLPLTKAVSARVNIPVIASGGAGKPEDFFKVFSEANADAALAASVFHYQKIRIPDLKSFLSEKGVSMRCR